MIAADRVAAILLAAGGSARFGPADKLHAELDGRPLVTHAAALIAGFGFGGLVAVCARTTVTLLPGFDIVINDASERGQSHSIRLGVAHALEQDVDAVLVMLGDMPFVPASHLRALLASDGAIIASSLDGQAMPPALFSRDAARALLALEGDRGARGLLRGAVLVPGDAAMLADIDRPSDLRR
ncbi:nucleotidyltransferase family protein [Sphingomonas colocasiae]|uniref:Nucleotidyltransferase family protein n=1 Tax=Sphingomonas colocasiae TaxID=1848973 RepID=A0ABS7PRR3_9SPHN|nr:nucleotidyltransferase family protein [Sphingomonas colocasiae]MBY8823956.1 nucleotidyltransferase family protein [Sphingomonas colocasiae]